jgi:hypothetical protein
MCRAYYEHEERELAVIGKVTELIVEALAEAGRVEPEEGRGALCN